MKTPQLSSRKPSAAPPPHMPPSSENPRKPSKLDESSKQAVRRQNEALDRSARLYLSIYIARIVGITSMVIAIILMILISIWTPKTRALITRTPTKRTLNFQRQPSQDFQGKSWADPTERRLPQKMPQALLPRHGGSLLLRPTTDFWGQFSNRTVGRGSSQGL